MEYVSYQKAALTQLVECLAVNQNVVGSSPASGVNFSCLSLIYSFTGYFVLFLEYDVVEVNLIKSDKMDILACLARLEDHSFAYNFSVTDPQD